ncbi:MAG: aspartate carbamoyltransferase catalytic subunit [Acidimicrobiales bacterium]
MRHLLDTAELTVDGIASILDVSDHMTAINARPVPKVPALRGRTVASVFLEDSTRTRHSFETAARRLSADVMTFSASTSSVNKGESLRDTIETLDAMGVDVFVVRHKSSGVPAAVTAWTSASVVNAGDGWHQHPTQGLLDAYTVTRSFSSGNSMSGMRVAIVGDVRHSRVARSTVDVFRRLGADVVLVGPGTLLPPDGLGCRSVDDLDSVVADVDVLYMLRMQRERMDVALVPDTAEYSVRFGLTPQRASRLRQDAVVMHPGPMNRGVEMLVDPASLPGSRILAQVRNGVAVRMAVLFTLLGGAPGGLMEGQ